MIDAIGAASVNMNASYEAAQTKADAAKFEDVLKSAQQEAADAGKGLREASSAAGAASAGTKVGAAASSAAAAAQDAKLRDACEGFEEMFMELMYKEMRNTVPDDTLLGNSNANKIWQSMMDSELMKSAAKGGGVGLADMLYKQLKPPETTKNTNSAVNK